MMQILENSEQPNGARGNQPLETKDKLYFTMVWWGVPSWSRVNSYKENGYNRKYKEARQFMFMGVTVYGVVTLIFILALFQDW